MLNLRISRKPLSTKVSTKVKSGQASKFTLVVKSPSKALDTNGLDKNSPYYVDPATVNPRGRISNVPLECR